MKLFVFPSVVAFLAQLSSCSPTPTVEDAAAYAEIVKRATITDVANLGYATQNGGYFFFPNVGRGKNLIVN